MDAIKVGQTWIDTEKNRRFIITAKSEGISREEPAWSVEVYDSNGTKSERPVVYESTIQKFVLEVWEPEHCVSRLSKVQ